MTEEPYRWLEAIGNRREYVQEQLKGGAPVFAASLPEGILLAGVGAGSSKVFEVFDRHALAAIGHPSDVEKVRQMAIDSAHVEGFTRAPEDVTLRRLVGFGMSSQLKTNFEQLFSAPYLVELLFVELADRRENDVLARLHFDGTFNFNHSGVAVAAPRAETEEASRSWLAGEVDALASPSARDVADLMLQAWWCLSESRTFDEQIPPVEERQSGWRRTASGKTVELGWLARENPRRARYEALTLDQLQL